MHGMGDTNSETGTTKENNAKGTRSRRHDATLCENCDDLATVYLTDFDGSELYAEICDCRMLLRTRLDSEPTTPLEPVSFIVSNGEDVFPTLRVALQILITIAVLIASCECSFSKL